MSERGDSPDNPATCHLPVGERNYLNALRCPAGTPYRFHRLGSVAGTCPEPETHEGPHSDPSEQGSIPVDHYELTCGCGEHTRDVYLDMYHPTASAPSSQGPAVVGAPLTAAAAATVTVEGDEEGREKALKLVLERHLRPGERFVIEKDDEGEVEVTAAKRSGLAKTHPRFYGFLLASSQRISNAAGCGLFVFYTSLGSALCFGIKTQAFHGLAGGDTQIISFLDQLRTWWVYAPILFVTLWLYWKHDDRAERRQYESEREELAEHLTREDLDPYETVASLEDDGEVATILKWMKADQGLGRLQR